jgi:hypothetical protein
MLSKKFMLSKALSHPEGLELSITCDTGAAASGSEIIVAGTTYVNGGEIAAGENVQFCYDETGTLMPGFYPYGEPLGNMDSGKGRGHILTGDQRARSGSPFEQSSNISYGVEGRVIMVESTNGIINLGMSIHNFGDDSVDSIPDNTAVHFHFAMNPDGNWEAAYVSKSQGDCDKPAGI